MAEFSLFHTTGTSGDGASAYTQTQTTDWLRRTFLKDPTTECVHRGYANELSLTPVNGASPKVTVGTGAAIVYGFPYENTAALDLSFTKPAVGTTGYRIVLRLSYAAHTVRLTLLSSADGVSAIPAATQTAGTTWDMTLATFTCTTGGAITLTDSRGYAHPNTGVSAGMIDAGAVGVAALSSAVAGNGLTGGGGSALAVNVDSTLQIVADAVGVADNSIDDLKAGNRIAQFYRRQGGSASNNWTGGSATQTPAAVRVQWGTINLGSVPAGSGATGSVTFPVVFSDVPWVMISAAPFLIRASLNRGVSGNAPTATGFSYEYDNAGGSAQASTLTWIAIGPE